MGYDTVYIYAICPICSSLCTYFTATFKLLFLKLCLKVTFAGCYALKTEEKNSFSCSTLRILSFSLPLPPLLTFFNPPQPSQSFLSAWPCPVKQETCCGVVTHNCGQLHGRFCLPFFCSGVQSASICHCLTTVPLGEMGLILQSISRRAAFVLSLAPMGTICSSAPSLSLHFDGSHFLSHLFVHGSLTLFGCVISFVSSCSSLSLLSFLYLYFVFSFLYLFVSFLFLSLT